MFWYLYLAHLIADYPLQLNWMVAAKRHWKGMLLHISIHVLVLLIMTWPVARSVWPYVLALAVIHLTIDSTKNVVNRLRPKWVIAPYVIDQIIHLASVLAVALWIEQKVPADSLSSARPWLAYAIGFLLATYVWFVSERILAYTDEAYRLEIHTHGWTRMITRALMVWALLSGMQAWLGPVILAMANWQLPYFSGKFRRRAFIIDFLVALLCSIITWSAIELIR
jgi:hypothetical protein